MAPSITHRAYSHIFSTYPWTNPTYLVPLIPTFILLAYAGVYTRRKLSKPAEAQGFKPDTSKPCKYRMDDSTSSTLKLSDGRKLGYAQYGAATGKAVIYLHGLPGSRIEGAAFEQMANEAGARVIALDRPGYGWSTPQPGRTLLDHAADVRALAEHLDLREYGVLGISGGGPYALACAAANGDEKLKAVAVICGMGMPDMSKRGMNWMHWLGFTVGFAYLPGVCRWWIKSDVSARLDLSDEEKLRTIYEQFWASEPHEKDVEFFRDLDYMRLSVRGSREAFGQGVGAFLHDGKLMSTDWGFRVEDIRGDLPVRLWYGSLDTNCPVVHGQETAARLKGNGKLTIVEETHASIFTNYRGKALIDLLESM